MGKARPCAICGKPTKRLVLEHSLDETAICSKACQNKYVETLSYEKAPQIQELFSIDNRIATVRICETCCWITAALGLVLIIVGVVLTRMLPVENARTGSNLFLIGAIPLTVGAIATEHFIGLRRKLTEKRHEIM